MDAIYDPHPKPSLSQSLSSMREILVRAVDGGSLAREHAVAYIEVRARLLKSEIGDMLPGFLYQCRTVVRFSDFISLYDPDTELRIAFIDSMIDRCRRLPAVASADMLPVHEDGRKGSRF